MDRKQRIRATLRSEPVDHPPAALWGHDFLREWTPDDLVASTLDAWKPYDWDFIKFNPRATYFAEAWGNTYERPVDQRQPRPLEMRVRVAADLLAIEPLDPRAGVLGEHLLALRMLLHEVGDDIDVLHTVFSPLSVVAMLAGPPERFRELARDDPGAAHHAVRSVAGTLAAYAAAAVEAGAAGIFFAPLTWASSDTADYAFYREFGRPYDLQVLDAVRSSEFNVLHVCRNRNMLAHLLDYPVAAFNWADRGEGNPTLGEARTLTTKAIMGGIDHARLHTMTPADVVQQAQEAMAVGAGVMVTGGCAIPPQTPAENRRAVSEAVRSP